MHPILFKIGDFAIYTYGLTMALAFVIAFGWVFQEAKRNGENLDDFYNICLIALVGGVIGARLLYIITTWREFSGHPLRMLNLREGGLVWYGGVILVVAMIWGYARRRDMSFYRISDIMSAPLVVGLAVGRLGCLMSGCCYGCPTDLPWGIRYPVSPMLPAEIAGVKVHPSPIYEMIGALAIAGIVTVLQRRKTREGQPTWAMFLLYGVLRYVLEFFRGDELRGFVIPGYMSTSQFISIPLVIISLAMLWRLRTPSSAK